MKTRFCPSPTGYMHLGNARTALFNYLLAQSNQGNFLLRIEDTDRDRSQHNYTEALQSDLTWLGCHWQEGFQAVGDQGPYEQSQRQAIYEKYYALLEATDHVYCCFCSDAELKAERDAQRAKGLPPRYSGKCRQLTDRQVASKKSEGLSYSLRFKVPINQRIEFLDLVKQTQVIESDHMSDFIIRRADGSTIFLFCNALDDALMGVTHVLRGDDHLTNTARQLLLLQALQLPAPIYAHMPLIKGSDGNPLSKRNGSRSIKALREVGYLPLAIANYLARLGHHYSEIAVMDLTELAVQFSMHAISRSAACFDEGQLNHWQKQVLMQLDQPSLWAWMEPTVGDLVSCTTT